MHDSLLVRGAERAGDLAREVQSLGDGERCRAEPEIQGLALDELEHEKPHAVLLVETVDRGDVGMVDRRQRPSLPRETGQVLGVPRQGVGEDLDRHLAFELAVPRPIDLAHPARAERRDDLVGAQPEAGRERHARAS